MFTWMRILFSKKPFLLFLLVVPLLSGQMSIERPGAAALLVKKAQNRWAAGNFDEAFALSQQAREKACVEADTLSLLTAQRQIGKYYARNGFLDEAEATLDSVIASSQWIGPLHHEILMARGERADIEAWRGDFGRCVALYQDLARDCKSLAPNDTLRPLVFQWVGQAFAYIDQYDSALSYCHQSLEAFARLGRPEKADVAYTENALGIIYFELDQPEEAIRHLDRALDILSRVLRPGHSHVIQVRSNTAVQYQSLGLPWKSIELYKTNLMYLDSLKPTAQLSTLFNYASALTMVGDYHETLRYLDQAEALMHARPGLRPDGLNKVHYARAAALESLKQYEQSLLSIQAAIASDLLVYGPDHSQLVVDYLRLGTVYSHMHNYPEAIQALQKALNLAVRVLDPHAMRTGWIWESMGEAQTGMGAAGEAIQSYRQAVRIFQAGRMEWNLVGTYRDMATAWQQIGNPDSNLVCLQKAWRIAMPDLPFQPAPSSDAYAYWMDTQLAGLLEVQGKSMEWRYAQSQNLTDLEAALASYEAFLAVSDSQRYYYEARESQQQHLRDQRAIVEKGLAICHELYQQHGDKAYLRRALLMTEQSKANQLRDHLRGQSALTFAGIPDSLIEQEQYFRQRLAVADAARYEEEADSARTSLLREAHFGLNQAYHNLLRNLEQEHPRYFRLKYPKPLDTKALEEQTSASQQALYSYFWGEKELFIFHLERGEWNMSRIEADSSLTNPLMGWLDFLAQPPGTSPSESMGIASEGALLCKRLLPGLSDGANPLLIVPDGLLGYLPFESLLSGEVSDPAFRTWPFLAREHAVTYTYAADLWLQQTTQPPMLAAAYLGFAPDFGHEAPGMERAGLKPLRYNREEVEAAARLLHGRVLTGVQASESVVKSLGNDPLILHFATHALADEARLMNSRLYFDQQTDAAEDGVLHLYEIYGLSLNSPLTVLSACQTGKGPLMSGEGVMSLARAFQYSGSRRVLASRWQADDPSSAKLTTSFFEALSADVPAAEALRLARSHWLTSSDNYHCHPYFWAGYALIGEGGPVLIQRPGLRLNGWLLIGSVGGLVLLLLLYQLVRRQA